MTGILIAVDSTPAAVPVLRTGALLARRLGWTAEALHVGPVPGPGPSATSWAWLSTLSTVSRSARSWLRPRARGRSSW